MRAGPAVSTQTLMALALLGVLTALMLASVRLGTAELSWHEVWTSLLQRAPKDDPQALALQGIVLELRVPRALLALCVGAGLAVVGALLQTVTRNDLADPFLFGLSSGAAAGAVAVITLLGDALGPWSLPVAAFAGAMASTLAVLLLMGCGVGHTSVRLVLAGLSVSFLFSAITHYLIFAGDQRAAHSALFWTLGSLGLVRWAALPYAVAGLALVLVYAVWRRRQLDGLLGGEEIAYSLGIRPDRLRREVFLVCALTTASFVALCGVIGFVGLMVPHLARALGGVLHSGMLVFSALIGAVLLVGSDVLSRVLLVPQELPVGIVTGTLGALFVLALLVRAPRGTGAVA